ncbi:MAG: endonuclease MutS2 [Chloroflexi bacterium]|nr:endonuclease MutS2 [Chloroflexota bacterium]
MHPRSLRVLEFAKILDQLAQHTSFSASYELALALTPATDPDIVSRTLAETTEAKDYLDRRGGLSLGGAHDIRPYLRIAVIGGMLEPEQLLDIRDTLSAARTLRRAFLREAERYPLLAANARELAELPELSAEIERCINDKGEVVDSASATLARIRKDLRIAHERMQARLQSLLSSSGVARYLQEPLITQREGRYVIPVKADFKGRIAGIVHDTSASGATIFIEPLVVVELGNRVRELQLQEKKEIERILREVTSRVGAYDGELNQTIEAIARLDLHLAKARYSQEIRGRPPEIVPPYEAPSHGSSRKSDGIDNTGPFLKLTKARHPLLNPEHVVPIDIQVGLDYRILVITGPNTGGKTVSLKTAGLLMLMAQAGLHVPVGDGSSMRIFSGIFADIGDEQSIEQNLSTFSSHMTNIVEILEQADAAALVLLDELGAGTDPVEGSALARAILENLLARQITTVATTHYSELKLFAYDTDGVANASVEFNVETLSPTYVLTIGLPGRSNAFAIARRLGLPDGIISQARQNLSTQHQEMEEILTDIKKRQGELESQEINTRLLRTRLEQEQAEAERKSRSLESERLQILNEARQTAQQELELVREEVAKLRSRLARISMKSPDAASEGTKMELENTLKELAELAEFAEPQKAPLLPPASEQEIHPGDKVWVSSLHNQGEVLSIDDDQAEVRVGSFRARVALADLEVVSQRQAEQLTRNSPMRSSSPADDVRSEIHLIGLRGVEALERLDKYLDDAFLANLPKVRIVHGKGSGTLRRLIRDALRENSHVKAFRAGDRYEGDEGVTIAEMDLQ